MNIDLSAMAEAMATIFELEIKDVAEIADDPNTEINERRVK